MRIFGRVRQRGNPAGAVLRHLFGFALHMAGERGRPLYELIEQFNQVLFRIVDMIMRVAPVGAFGAMAFTIGKYGLGTLGPARQADGLLLLPLACCSSSSCWARFAGCTGSASGVYLKYIRRSCSGAGHLVLRSGACRPDGQDRITRRAQVCRRAGDSGRLFVQPGRHVHLPDHGAHCSSPKPPTRRWICSIS